MASPVPQTKEGPTTFFSLPSELRQDILLHLFTPSEHVSETQSPWSQFSNNRIAIHRLTKDLSHIRALLYIPRLLNIYPLHAVAQDISYVEKKWARMAVTILISDLDEDNIRNKEDCDRRKKHDRWSIRIHVPQRIDNIWVQFGKIEKRWRQGGREFFFQWEIEKYVKENKVFEWGRSIILHSLKHRSSCRMNKWLRHKEWKLHCYEGKEVFSGIQMVERGEITCREDRIGEVVRIKDGIAGRNGGQNEGDIDEDEDEDGLSGDILSFWEDYAGSIGKKDGYSSKYPGGKNLEVERYVVESRDL